MGKRVSRVTFHYILITAGFWMAYCMITTNAAVFLQAIGYTNVQLGIILAVANIGGALLSTMVGDLLDRFPRLRHIQLLHVLCAAQAVPILLLWIHPVSGWMTSVLYTLYCCALMAVNAVNLDLCVRLEHTGAELNFGLARAMGSLTFMIVSVLMGVLVERFSHMTLLYGGLVMVAWQVVSNLLIDRDMREAEAAAPALFGGKREKSASLLQFIRQNPSFFILLVGITLLFTSHNIDNNFMINEVRALGGGTVEMGWVAAFQALVEIPVMIYSARLSKKRSLAWYIRLSFVFFVVKILAYALAPNMFCFFAARVLQAPSYALYIVLIVPYADKIVPTQDSAKAQGLLVSVTNLGAVAASLAGGALLDSMGVRFTMFFATGIAALGCIIGCIGAKEE